MKYLERLGLPHCGASEERLLKGSLRMFPVKSKSQKENK
jgi:hypothetical protein